MLEKDGGDQLNRSCEKWRTVTESQEERNIVHTIKRRKDSWIGHFLRRNCLLKHVIEGKIEVTSRRRRRRKQLLDERKEKRGYWEMKEEAPARTVWRTRFGRGYGPVIRQTTGRMNEWMNECEEILYNVHMCRLWYEWNWGCEDRGLGVCVVYAFLFS